MELLGAQQTHPGGTTFDQIVDEDGTVLLCLHYWGPTGASGKHGWQTLLTPGPSDYNGLLLWFVLMTSRTRGHAPSSWEQQSKRSRILTTELVSRPLLFEIPMDITLQSMSRGRRDPPNQGMEPTAKIVTPLAYERVAPFLTAAHPRRYVLRDSPLGLD